MFKTCIQTIVKRIVFDLLKWTLTRNYFIPLKSSKATTKWFTIMNICFIVDDEYLTFVVISNPSSLSQMWPTELDLSACLYYIKQHDKNCNRCNICFSFRSKKCWSWGKIRTQEDFAVWFQFCVPVYSKFTCCVLNSVYCTIYLINYTHCFAVYGGTFR